MVFRGRTQGIYHGWQLAQEQVHGFSNNRYRAYNKFEDAESAWAEVRDETGVNIDTAATYRVVAKKSATKTREPLVSISISNNFIPEEQSSCENIIEDQPLFNETPSPATPSKAQSFQHILTPQNDISIHVDDLESPPRQFSSSMPQFPLHRSRSLPLFSGVSCKRSSKVGTTSSPSKKARIDAGGLEIPGFKSLDGHEEGEPEQDLPVLPKPIRLSPEQQRVVSLALAGHNIFLTGAAGSGKTVTLQEIIWQLKNKEWPKEEPTERKQGRKVEIIAPTGIAALPLRGKTTYTFAGVSAFDSSVCIY